MLVRFSVQNFRSFKEQTSLSMVANGRLSQLKNHAMVVNDVSLLRGPLFMVPMHPASQI